MKQIGFEDHNVVYACLAETIVLTLEGRFENFTLGRNIEWEKVHEIYKLGLKHGMRLAAISGVNGVFSDEDIARVRELALRARQQDRSTSSRSPAARKRKPAGKQAVKRARKGSPTPKSGSRARGKATRNA